MTRKEIEALPAGEELDVAIGKMLGLANIRPAFAHYYIGGSAYYDEKENEECEPCVLYDHPKYGECEIPNYSTHIAAAWHVVSHYESFGCRLSLKQVLSAPQLEWRCEFLPPGGHRAAKAAGETAPLAICRAALFLFSTHSI